MEAVEFWDLIETSAEHATGGRLGRLSKLRRIGRLPKRRRIGRLPKLGRLFPRDER